MIYFASDVHLGLNFGDKTPKEREKIFVSFLLSIESDCQELFLVGDIFDFWFEWNRTVPKGYVRTLAQLQKMCENGTTIHFMPGNHDLWIKSYLQDEIGLTIHHHELITQRQGKTLYIEHGDKLYKHKGISRALELIFRSKTARYIGQRIIHPDTLTRFGMNWSASNRKKRGDITHQFKGENDYWVKASKQILDKQNNIDYFVFGHLHYPIIYDLNETAKMVVLGEWVQNPTYAVMRDGVITLKQL